MHSSIFLILHVINEPHPVLLKFFQFIVKFITIITINPLYRMFTAVKQSNTLKQDSDCQHNVSHSYFILYILAFSMFMQFI